jgi:hypothetical protein
MVLGQPVDGVVHPVGEGEHADHPDDEGHHNDHAPIGVLVEHDGPREVETDDGEYWHDEGDAEPEQMGAHSASWLVSIRALSEGWLRSDLGFV